MRRSRRLIAHSAVYPPAPHAHALGRKLRKLSPARSRRRLAVLEVLETARAAFLRRLRGVGLDLRLLRLARFLVRPLLSLGHGRSLLLVGAKAPRGDDHSRS